MSYRKILVPLVGSDRDKQVLAAAFSVAKTFNAHVAALFVRPEPSEALPYMGEGISGSVIQEVLDAAAKAADTALAEAKTALKAAAAAAQIPIVDQPGQREEATAALRVVQGHFAGVVENEARLSDLVIFGALAAEERVGLKEAFEATLLTEGRPALLVPRNASVIGGKVAIGYDGSTAAAHAVMMALPFIKRAKAIELLHVTSGVKLVQMLEPLKDYLALRGLSCSERVVDPGDKPMGAALLDAASNGGANLLVMGGFGHSRVFEFVFGGATRHILANASLPVFLAH